MRTRLSIMVSSALFGALLATTQAVAGPVYGTNVGAADMSGSRTFAAGEILGFIAGSPDSATISWNISAFDATTYRYTYTISTSARQTISHLILDLSDNCTSVGACFSAMTYNDAAVSGVDLSFGTFDGTGGASNPGLPAPITGVKFNRPDVLAGTTTYTVSFLSNRVAVWGDFYTKGGNGTSNGFSIYNDGVDEHLTSASVRDFIAVPDTVTACTSPLGCSGGAPDPSGDPVPVPGMAGLLALGALGLVATRRRQRA